MDLKHFFATFDYYGVVAFALFVFVLIGSGFLKQFGTQLKKEIHTARSYPDLLNIYTKYFRVRAGFNPIGAGAAGEPLFVVASPFPWSYRLEWVQNLLKISFAVLALLFGLVIIAIYFALKNQIAFSLLGMYVLLAVIIAALVFAWQKALRKKIKERLAEFNKEIDAYTLTHSVSRSDIALPLGYNYGNGLLRRSFMYALFAAVVWPLLLILAIQG